MILCIAAGGPGSLRPVCPSQDSLHSSLVPPCSLPGSCPRHRGLALAETRPSRIWRQGGDLSLVQITPDTLLSLVETGAMERIWFPFVIKTRWKAQNAPERKHFICLEVCRYDIDLFHQWEPSIWSGLDQWEVFTVSVGHLTRLAGTGRSALEKLVEFFTSQAQVDQVAVTLQ